MLWDYSAVLFVIEFFYIFFWQQHKFPFIVFGLLNSIISLQLKVFQNKLTTGENISQHLTRVKETYGCLSIDNIITIYTLFIFFFFQIVPLYATLDLNCKKEVSWE